jgi:hypothetical protein
MNAIRVYHVTPCGAGWSVETDADLDVSSSFADKGSALRHGQELARQAHAQLVVIARTAPSGEHSTENPRPASRSNLAAWMTYARAG